MEKNYGQRDKTKTIESYLVKMIFQNKSKFRASQIKIAAEQNSSPNRQSWIYKKT